MFAIQQMLTNSKDSLSSPATVHTQNQLRTPPATPAACASTSAASPSLSLVKVICRLRPCLAHEQSSSKSVVQVINRSQIRITDPVKNLVNRFDFSACYGESSTQQQIFDGEVRDMVMGIFSGITATIFTFGCTGSGKTHTLQGSPADPGIAPRAVRTVFDHIDLLRGGLGGGGQPEYKISLSCFEIWKDKVWDLLAEGGTAATRDLGRGDLPIREAANGQVFVPNLRRVPLSDCARFNKLYDQVMGARSVSSTKLNHASSRSHAVLTIYVSQLRAGKSFEGKCVLIDLAGSENNKKTGNDTNKERMKESVEINQSLLTLRKVVRSLNAGDVRIPYRDSKLTRILSDSLGGTSAGLVICNVAPHASQYRDTMNTLNFGSNSRNVENKVSLKPAGSGDRQLRPLGYSLYQQASKSAPHLPLPASAPSAVSPPKLNWPRHPALASLPNGGLPLPNSPARAASDFAASRTPPFGRRQGVHIPPPVFSSGGSRSVLPSRSMSPVLSVESSADSALEGHSCGQSNSSDYSVAAAELERRVNQVIEKNMDELVHKRVDALLEQKLKQASPGAPTSESGKGHSGGAEDDVKLAERITNLEQQLSVLVFQARWGDAFERVFFQCQERIARGRAGLVLTFDRYSKHEHQQLAPNRHPSSAILDYQDPESASVMTLSLLSWAGDQNNRAKRLRSGIHQVMGAVETVDCLLSYTKPTTTLPHNLLRTFYSAEIT